VARGRGDAVSIAGAGESLSTTDVHGRSQGGFVSVSRVGALVVVLGSLLPVPVAAAQVAAAGGTAGEIKDTTGAVLPGVTVEAASSALIEKSRTVVSDERGQYKIVDLRPGSYTVTFT